MMGSINNIHQKISEYIERLTQDLKVARGSDFPGSFRTGTWLEKQKTILGFISINPHRDPEEETIDIGFKIEVNEILDITIDICWSDGEILRTIAKESFPSNSPEKMGSELELLLQRVTPNILGEVDKIFKQNLAPRYRGN